MPQEAQPAGVPGRPVVLRTERLSKHFGRLTAVQNLNLEVHQGDVFGLLGPNGSGKTTTLRMILGLIWPTEGQISLFGSYMEDDAQRRAALQRIGAIVEQPAFYPYLNGRENLQGVATFAGLPGNDATSARIDVVLAQVGLAPRAKDAYKRYSLGMKQRLGIAAALLTQPEMIILDEPTNGLDPAGMVEVRALIGQLAQRGITVLLSSHLLHEVQQVCTRVAILNRGMLVTQGEVAQLLAAQSGIQFGFTDPDLLSRAANALHEIAGTSEVPWLRGVRYVQPEPGAWTPPGGWLLLVDAPPEQAAAVNAILGARGIYASEVRRREASLEQFFLALTSGQPAPPAQAAPPPALASAPTYPRPIAPQE
ncbi:MAG TPA: ABC transporter ATP-binding protein [Ktedonobacterales bacterium]|nr:ABC transporter ATP-binding protein [Ktedonobacterales bacterium]